MGNYRGLASLLLLITLSFCFHDVYGSQCRMKISVHSKEVVGGMFNCPTILDPADNAYCCGNANDSAGQTCCSIQDYFISGDGRYIIATAVGIILFFVVFFLVLCCCCPCCLLHKRRQTEVVYKTLMVMPNVSEPTNTTVMV